MLATIFANICVLNLGIAFPCCISVNNCICHFTPLASDADRLLAALEEADGDLEKAAARLGVSRTTFWRMRKRAGV